MQQQFAQFQTFQKDGQDAVLKSVSALSRGAQAVALEVADYTKRSYEQGSSTFEKLVGARTMDRAVEIQTDFAKTSYESFVAQATKVGEIVQSTTKEAFAPLSGLMQRPVA